jgi:hypothetical protein
MRTKFWLGSLKERDNSEDLGLDWRTILKWEIGLEGMNWIHPAQGSDWWRAVVNTAMNLWVPFLEKYNYPNFTVIYGVSHSVFASCSLGGGPSRWDGTPRERRQDAHSSGNSDQREQQQQR